MHSEMTNDGPTHARTKKIIEKPKGDESKATPPGRRGERQSFSLSHPTHRRKGGQSAKARPSGPSARNLTPIQDKRQHWYARTGRGRWPKSLSFGREDRGRTRSVTSAGVWSLCAAARKAIQCGQSAGSRPCR